MAHAGPFCDGIRAVEFEMLVVFCGFMGGIWGEGEVRGVVVVCHGLGLWGWVGIGLSGL